MAIESKRPQVSTNQKGRSVAKALRSFISGAVTESSADINLDIASGYFNIGGYAELANALDSVSTTRLLLGVEPDDTQQPRTLRGENAESAFSEKFNLQRAERAVQGLLKKLKIDRNLLGFTYDIDQATQKLVKWLDSDEVETRILKDQFLHGKVYLLSTDKYGVMAGSSNFTKAGLTTNVEFNLGNYNDETVEIAQDWFNEYWSKAEEYDLARLYRERYEPHHPQLIYLKMLWEWERAAMDATQLEETGLDLTDFQTHGLARANRILDNFNGVLIADEVGLGKTFIAGEIILEYLLRRRQRVLVIAPATLRDGTWKSFESNHLKQNLEVISFDQLRNDYRLNEKALTRKPALKFNPEEYSLIVVDEAHNARNTSAQQAFALRELLKGTPRKKLLLLTATPVNNSLWDLYNLLNYFLLNDGVFADTGINSLCNHFEWAMNQDADDLSPQHLFDVIDPVTVRRTRKFIKKYYSGSTYYNNGEELQIHFPEPRVTRVDYDFGAELPSDFFAKFSYALDPTDISTSKESALKYSKLTMARYTPSSYLRSGERIHREMQTAGLLRSGLLKRFESSPCAFANTCQRMVSAHNSFLSLLLEGKVATGEALTDWATTDSDDIDSIDKFFDHHVDLLSDANDYKIKPLQEDVENDRDLLQGFADTVGAITPSQDPALKAIMDELRFIATEAESEGVTEEGKRNHRKVLIFSYYADTVEWVYNYLNDQTLVDPELSVYEGRVASISGSRGESSYESVTKEDVLWGFAPKTMEAPEGLNQDKYDIVVTTDVLAEGVNLQQARHIINYDLPWNPMRLVQRHGRIDRIGSPHDKVFIRCVFPDSNLDDLLGLEQRIRLKIKQAAASIGVEGDVIPGEPGGDQVFTEQREEIEKLRQEDAMLFEKGGIGNGAMSGEEFRRELAEELEDFSTKEQLEALPWGSGSGMQIESHSISLNTEFIFCVRVADHDTTLFRHVIVDVDGNAVVDKGQQATQVMDESEADKPSTGIVGNTLACLSRARPVNQWNTTRVLDDQTQRLAYVAWAAAVEEIEKTWSKQTDPREVAPRLEKAQRDAIHLLRSASQLPNGATQDEIDKAIEKIETRLSSGRVSAIGAAIREKPGQETTSADKAETLLETLDELGLEPQKPPSPLPPMTTNDIHLVCWMALTPPEKSDSAEEPATK